jgi:hypothetical protein
MPAKGANFRAQGFQDRRIQPLCHPSTRGNRKASRFATGSVVVAGVAGEDDRPAVGRGGGLLDQALVG